MQSQVDLSGIAPRAIVIIGVSGSGKSTLGPLLATRLRCRFLEGDDFHCSASIAKMRAGQPLIDEDRWPWLDRLGAEIKAAIAVDGVSVAACSALKRSHRERLSRIAGAPVLFILLKLTRHELTRRLGERPGHFMPTSLLSSQLDALEMPTANESVLSLDARQQPEDLCRLTLAWLLGAAASGVERPPE